MPGRVKATVHAVANPSILGGTVVWANQALTQALHDAQITDRSSEVDESYYQANVRVDASLGAAHVAEVQDSLAAEGFNSQSVAQKLGAVQALIDAVIVVLNGFALVALLAAGFGIVNTLLTSVQERTREIGLMKAMGMSGTRIFALFSIEAVFIAAIGTLVGMLATIGLGTAINPVLSESLLADLPSLTLFVFTAPNTLAIFATVLALSFLAATAPAVIAARKNPIVALRYE